MLKNDNGYMRIKGLGGLKKLKEGTDESGMKKWRDERVREEEKDEKRERKQEMRYIG